MIRSRTIQNQQYAETDCQFKCDFRLKNLEFWLSQTFVMVIVIYALMTILKLRTQVNDIEFFVGWSVSVDKNIYQNK